MRSWRCCMRESADHNIGKAGPAAIFLPPKKKWGPALLPAPTAPSEGSASLHQTGPETRFLKSGSPAQASLPIDHSLLAEEPGFSSRCAGPKTSLPFGVSWPDPKVKANRFSAALLGTISCCGPLCSSFRSEELQESRVAQLEDRLFRRLFPADPLPLRRASALPAAEIGPLVTCRTFVPFPVFQ